MDCPQYRVWISDYLSGALSADQKKALEQHAAVCPACARELAAERRLEDVLSSRPLKTPPADFTQRVLARAVSRPVRATPAWAPLLAYAASLAALLLGAYRLVGLIFQPHAVREMTRSLAKSDLPAVSIPYPGVGNALDSAFAQVSGALDALAGGGQLLPDLPSGVVLAGAGAILCLIAVTCAFYFVSTHEQRWPG